MDRNLHDAQERHFSEVAVALSPEASPENVVWHSQAPITSHLLHILSKSLFPSLPPGEYQMLFNAAPLATESRQEIIPSCILECITSVNL